MSKLYSSLRLLLLIISLMSIYQLAAQTEGCQMIYRTSEISTHYKTGPAGLSKFTMITIAPLIAPDTAFTEPVITHLHILLTVNQKGKVINAEVPGFEGSKEQEESLKKGFFAMTGWMPLKVKNQPVCSLFDWKISCFKWDSEQKVQ